MFWLLLDRGHDLKGRLDKRVRNVDVKILLRENVDRHVGGLDSLGDMNDQLPGLKQWLPVRISDVEVVHAGL